MGERIKVQLPLWEIFLGLTNHQGQLSLAITVGRHNHNEYQPKGGDW